MKLRMMGGLVGMVAILALGMLGSVTAQAQGYSINETDTPYPSVWDDSEAGWLVTPNDSFTLTSISSTFADADGAASLVTVAVYTTVPSEGGVLITSGQEDVTAAGGDITFDMDTPATITAGDTYFVAFENISNVDFNVTDDAGAVMPGTEYFDNDGSSWENSDNSDFFDQPILSLNGTPLATSTPEPASLAGMGLGALGLAGLMLRARRRRVGLQV